MAKALTHPNLPSDGVLVTSYNPIEGSAHEVGRALQDIKNPDLNGKVNTEVQAELATIEQAELGGLDGRARRALALTPADASPARVQAADKILAKSPFGNPEPFTKIEPAAATIAAAHWLRAAADVAAEKSGYAPTQLVKEAENIEAFAHETPTLVLQQLELGSQPIRGGPP